MFNLRVVACVTVVLSATLLAGRLAAFEQQVATQEPATREAGSRDADSASFTARIVGLQVSREISDRWARHGAVRSMVTNNASSTGGIRLLLEVSAAEGKIIGLDERNLRIDKFVDDTDRDLRPSRDSHNRYSYGGQSVAEDGAAALMQIYSDRGPAPEAKQIFVEGVIPIRSTPEEQVSEPMTVPLSIGKQLEVGTATMTVAAIQLWGQDGSGLQVTVRSPEPLDMIRSIELVGDGGNPTKLPITIRGSKAEGHSVNQLGFIIPEITDEVRLRFTHTERVEQTDLRFSATIDLGKVELTSNVDAEEE